MIKKFEDIFAWQKAKILTTGLYRSLRDCRDYAFKDQICRASVSIMNNIAEGFERKGHKELERFLFIAKASSAEVRSMLYLAIEFEYLSNNDFNEYYHLSNEIACLLSAFIKSLK